MRRPLFSCRWASESASKNERESKPYTILEIVLSALKYIATNSNNLLR